MSLKKLLKRKIKTSVFIFYSTCKINDFGTNI